MAMKTSTPLAEQIQRHSSRDLKTPQRRVHEQTEDLHSGGLEGRARDTVAELQQRCKAASHSQRRINRFDDFFRQELEQLRCTVRGWESSGGELQGLVKGLLGEVRSLSQRVVDLNASVNSRVGGAETSLRRHSQELDQLRTAEHRMACARAEDASANRAQVNALSQSVNELAHRLGAFEASCPPQGTGDCAGGSPTHDLDVRAQLAAVSHQVAGLQARVVETESDLEVLRRRFIQPEPPISDKTSVRSPRAVLVGRIQGSKISGESPGSERSGALEAVEIAQQATDGLARAEERMEVLAERMGHAMHRLGSGEQAAEALRSQLSELREDVRRQVVSLRGDLEAQMQSWIARISPLANLETAPHNASSGRSSPVSVEQTAEWPTSLIEDSNDCLTRSEDTALSPQAWVAAGDKSNDLDPLNLPSKEGCISPIQKQNARSPTGQKLVE